MKRSKAFILVEILTGMALQAVFILTLCTSFYLMLSFYTRTQQTLAARQKGKKVIAYVDARIRNVGLGLRECDNSSEVRDSLYPLSSALLENKNLTLPVAVTQDNWNYKAVDDSDKKFKGNRLTLLYTQRPSEGLNFTINTIESPDKSGKNIPITVSQNATEVGFVTGSSGKIDYNASDFSPYASKNSLNSYTVMVGAGKPLYIQTTPKDNGRFKLNLQTNTSSTPYVEVYPGDELLYLKCERFFVEGQNFKFKRFGTEDNGGIWAGEYSNEEGILEVYFELDTSQNILDMYVLASGGNNTSKNTQKPSAWPSEYWKSEYASYTIYMSRASWKLHNIPTGFDWN